MIQTATPIAFSGNIPENYDKYLGPMFFEQFSLEIATRIGKIGPEKVLELAAGTGRLTKLLPAVTPQNASIHASDINPAMVQLGKSLASHKKITWEVVDGTEIAHPNDAFDIVAIQFGVMFYQDRLKGLKEALRVLKPGGTLIFSCWNKLENNPMALITNNLLEYYFPTNTPAFYQIPFSYHNTDLINSELKEAGFKTINIELVKLSGYSPTAADAAKGLIEGTPTITAITERDKDILPALLKDLEIRISNIIGKYSLKVPLEAYVVTCSK